MKKELLNQILAQSDRIITYFIFFALPLIFSNSLMFPFHSSKEIVLTLCVTFVGIVALLKMTKAAEITIKISSLDILIILFAGFNLGWGVIYFPKEITTHSTIQISLFAVLYLILQNFFGGVNNSAKKILFALLLSCLLESLLVFNQFYFDVLYKYIDPARYNQMLKNGILGTMGNPNGVAGFLAAAFPFSLYQLKEKKRRFLKVLFAAVLLSAIVMTESRGAILSLAIGIGYIVFRSAGQPIKKWKTVIKVILFSALVAIILSIGIYAYNLNERSITGRFVAWSVTLQMVHDNPLLGVGPDQFSYNYAKYQQEYLKDAEHIKYFDYADNQNSCHNQYLQILAETGLIGLMLFLAIIYYYYKQVSALLRIESIGNIKWLIKLSISSMIIILTHSLVDSILVFIPISMMLFLNLSIIAGIYKSKS